MKWLYSETIYKISYSQYPGRAECLKFDCPPIWACNDRIISSFLLFSSFSFCTVFYKASFSYQSLETSSFSLSTSIFLLKESINDYCKLALEPEFLLCSYWDLTNYWLLLGSGSLLCICCNLMFSIPLFRVGDIDARRSGCCRKFMAFNCLVISRA